MKKILLIIVLALLTTTLRAQDPLDPQFAVVPTLSPTAFASVITCGSGEEFYTTFGHSAIRVCDTSQQIDVVYNYGTFNFNIPHFYWTFARGRLDYSISRSTYPAFLFEYGYEGRAVWEQRLRLTNQEVNNLFVLLETNYLPEYRYYKYDFFRDNCATRVRDMVASCLCHRTLSPEQTCDTNLTYRQLLYRYTNNNLLWWRLGVDIALGQRCDHRCSNYEYMFSPIEMMRQYDTMLVSDTRQPLCEPALQVLQETRPPLHRSLSPTLLFYVVFLAVVLITLLQWRKGWRLAWFDAVLFALPFLISVVVIFLWFFTNHYCTRPNLNILWASPLFIYFAIRQNKSHPIVVIIQLVMLLAAMVMTLAPLPQQINQALLPVCLTLTLRLISILKVNSTKQK